MNHPNMTKKLVFFVLTCAKATIFGHFPTTTRHVWSHANLSKNYVEMTTPYLTNRIAIRSRSSLCLCLPVQYPTQPQDEGEREEAAAADEEERDLPVRELVQTPHRAFLRHATHTHSHYSS